MPFKSPSHPFVEDICKRREQFREKLFDLLNDWNFPDLETYEQVDMIMELIEEESKK